MRITTAGAGIAAVALVATLAGCGGRAATAEGRLSSEELQGRWWTWASTEPAPTNPVGDEDGSACGRNQPEDVWFLAGTFGTQAERNCAVPEGVPLAFPLVNMFGTPADCADFMSTAEGSAVLDGEEVDADPIRRSRSRSAAVPATPSRARTGPSPLTGADCGSSCPRRSPASTRWRSAAGRAASRSGWTTPSP